MRPINQGTNERRTTALICIFLVAITWAVFAQTLWHEFVNYDDGSYVYQNQQVRNGLSLEGLSRAFTHVHSQNWHPLTTISHMLDSQLYGLKAGGHHLTNVLLHSIAVVLLFFVLRDMTGTVWRSAFVAAVFAIHPLHVESVAWIAERKDVLSGVFFMLTLIAYARYAREPSGGRYAVMAIVFALGLMSKPMLVTVPFVLLLLDYWPLNRIVDLRALGKLVVEKIPLLILSAFSCVATILAQQQATGAADELPLLWRIDNAIVSSVTYIGQMFWPAKLAVFYPHAENQLSGTQVFLAGALLLGLTALTFVFRRKHPYLLTGWLWYLIMLLPVIGLFQVGLQGHADRYTYLPQIGLYLMVTWSVAEMPLWHGRKQVLFGLSTAILVALGLCAVLQTMHWKNSEKLWRRALAVTPRNDVAETGLGGIFLGQGKVDDAITHFQEALKIRPRNAEAHRSLATALMRKGDAPNAIAHWEKSLELQPEDVTARDDLGVALVQRGQTEKAVEHWKKSLEYEPDDGNALGNLAWVLATAPDATLRDGEKAIQYGERALQLSGYRNAILFRTVAAAYAEGGRFAEAIDMAKRGIHVATDLGNSGLADELRRNITLYETNSPLRDNSLSASPPSP